MSSFCYSISNFSGYIITQLLNFFLWGAGGDKLLKVSTKQVRSRMNSTAQKFILLFSLFCCQGKGVWRVLLHDVIVSIKSKMVADVQIYFNFI